MLFAQLTVAAIISKVHYFIGRIYIVSVNYYFSQSNVVTIFKELKLQIFLSKAVLLLVFCV